MNEIPIFKNDDEEATFWDTHSPLDFIKDPIPEKVITKGPKDKVITFRLDSKSRKELDELAKTHNVGPSLLARLIVLSALGHKSSH